MDLRLGLMRVKMVLNLTLQTSPISGPNQQSPSWFWTQPQLKPGRIGKQVEPTNRNPSAEPRPLTFLSYLDFKATPWPVSSDP